MICIRHILYYFLLYNGNAASVDGGQKQHQIKQVIKFIQSTMQTLSEYEKQFQELFNTDLTQTKI